ncbi:hypothetical protein RF11_05327 [Thelohanellus kitauei]|uniref:Uncharacterized protein n=1 Tax=Thelohanellus kitauei TaxID=669202 RepID=A0A0C2JDV9_THEKT|nr:hypothetical protein RF11_05327 [Thelohanellus kitauei]
MNHTRAPNPDDNLVRNVRNNMRTLAVNLTSRPRQIISQVLGDADESVSARKAESFPFPLPSNASDLVIPEELKISYRGKRFLLFDISDVNVGRVLICSTDRQKNIDAFILFQLKSKECYNIAWNIPITNLDLNISSSMSDFESASINSLKEYFSNCLSSHLLKDEIAIIDNKINTLEMNLSVTPSDRANSEYKRLRTFVVRFNELDPLRYIFDILEEIGKEVN